MLFGQHINVKFSLQHSPVKRLMAAAFALICLVYLRRSAAGGSVSLFKLISEMAAVSHSCCDHINLQCRFNTEI